jgi:hypothetical protein
MPLLKDQGRVASQTYEAVLKSPIATVRATCETLGIEFTPTMLSFHLSADTRSDASATSVWSNLSRPLMKDNAGTFERYLDEDEIRFVESACADSMCRLGYQTTLPLARGMEFESLRGRLVPRERHEKSGYQRLPAAERELRRRRVEVLRRLAARLAAVRGRQ